MKTNFDDPQLKHLLIVLTSFLTLKYQEYGDRSLESFALLLEPFICNFESEPLPDDSPEKQSAPQGGESEFP